MDSIQVDLGPDWLKVIVPKKSDLLTGSHRIFLANILGLSISSEFNGYEVRGPASLEMLKETIRYLGDRGLEFTLNNAAVDFANRLKLEKNQLDESRVIGAKIKLSPPPKVYVPGLRRPLKRYQIAPVAHMVAVENGANFSVPGSGKTTITLSAFKILKSTTNIKKLVVIGPRASFMPWEDEYSSCFGRRAASTRIVGSPRTRKKLYQEAQDSEMVLMTYQMAYNDANAVASFLGRNPSLLVLDESHNIKRIDGGRWADALLQLAPFAMRRVVLSGTPVPNKLEDIWSQITFLWPDEEVLGDREAFKRRLERAGDRSATELRESIFPLYWRIRKEDLRLPPAKYHRIDVRMSRYQQAIYDALAAKTLSETVDAPEDRIKLRIWRRGRLVRLLEAASNPALLSRYSEEFRVPPLDASGLSVDKIIEKYSEFEIPAKIQTVVDLVQRIVAKDEKVIIWTSFIHNIKTFEHLLRDLNPVSIYGDVPKDDDENASYNREKIIRDFKHMKQIRMLIANPSVCAESISLQRVCHHAIYTDRTFNAAHYMQSQDRIHRIGLKPGETVHYYLIHSSGSIDEVIDARLEEKITRMKQLLAEDFGTVNLYPPEEEFSEENELDQDFDAVLANLRKKYGSPRR